METEVLRALKAEGGLLARAAESSQALEEAARAVADAEHEPDLFVTNPILLTTLGEKRFLEGVQARQQALDEARELLTDLRRTSGLAEELADGDLLAAWPALGIQEKRQLMHGLLDRVNVTRANRRGRHATPIGERTEILLRGEIDLRDTAAAPGKSARQGAAKRASSRRPQRPARNRSLSSTDGSC